MAHEILTKEMITNTTEPTRYIVEDNGPDLEELREHAKTNPNVTIVTKSEAEKIKKEQGMKALKEADDFIHLSLLAKKNCKMCFERGYMGKDNNDVYVPCPCAVKKNATLSGNERARLIAETKKMFLAASK